MKKANDFHNQRQSRDATTESEEEVVTSDEDVYVGNESDVVKGKERIHNLKLNYYGTSETLTK
jgi:hypothetical protein